MRAGLTAPSTEPVVARVRVATPGWVGPAAATGVIIVLTTNTNTLNPRANFITFRSLPMNLSINTYGAPSFTPKMAVGIDQAVATVDPTGRPVTAYIIAKSRPARTKIP